MKTRFWDLSGWSSSRGDQVEFQTAEMEPDRGLEVLLDLKQAKGC